MKNPILSVLSLSTLLIVLLASCNKDSADDIESIPKGTIVVEPICEDNFTNLGQATSRVTDFGYNFKVNFKGNYEKFPYKFLYIITPDNKSFLPLELLGNVNLSNAMHYQTTVYSCCFASPPTEFDRIYDINDMAEFSKEPRQTGFLRPTSGTYKFVLLFKETPDFEEGAFISTKVIDFTEGFLDYPCENNGTGYKPKPNVLNFTVEF